MGLWRATVECEVLGVHMKGGDIIELTDEQEKQIKVGKYVEEVPDRRALALDPNSKKTVKIGNKNLMKAKRSELGEIEGKPLDEGIILYPPARSPIQKGESKGGEIHATVFQTTR